MNTLGVIISVLAVSIPAFVAYIIGWYNGFDKGARSEHRRYVHVDHRGRGYYKPPKREENK